MKKKILFTAVISSMLLCSCSLFKTYDSTAKELNIYLLEKAIKGNNINDGKTSTVEARFIDGEKYIPYLTLQQYADFYKPYLQENAISEVSTTGSSLTWTISKDGQLYFATMISTIYGEVMKAGDISNALNSSLFERDTKGLMYALNATSSAVPMNDDAGYAIYTYDNTAFKHFRKNGEMYYPLGFYDNLFSNSSGLYHFYNYKNIYATANVDNYSKDFVDENGKTTSSDKEMAEITNGEDIPQYLITYNANMFVFTMENFYGLKYNYEIDSIKQYFKKKGLYDGFYLSDNAKRGEAFSSALASFDDNHTVLVSVNAAWGEDKTPRYGGPNMIKRSTLRKKLSDLKQETLEKYYSTDDYDYETGEWADTVISESKKTAMFYFDSFSFGSSEQIFNSDGSIKEDAKKFDTYLNFVNRLDSYKKDGDIENIIIDVSTNSGGTIGVMSKLLALLSKDNKAELHMFDEASSVVSKNEFNVDVNDDKQYKNDETYGDDFNFYILTSDASYSCGNAFPCYAQKLGIKTIGEKTGGGECVVDVHYMPNSEYVYHSSRSHIGYYDEVSKKFDGFERGAQPDYSLVPEGHSALLENKGDGTYIDNIPNNFYDIEYLETLITSK